jgi:hypothetical protein
MTKEDLAAENKPCGTQLNNGLRRNIAILKFSLDSYTHPSVDFVFTLQRYKIAFIGKGYFLTGNG